MKPKRIGDKFIDNASSTTDIYTVAAFFGKNGVEYGTAREAVQRNPPGVICVRNKEFGGSHNLESCQILKDEQ